MDYFSGWTEQDQIEFVEELLVSMHHHQHGTVNAFLKPMLQRDFISLLPKKVSNERFFFILGVEEFDLKRIF